MRAGKLITLSAVAVLMGGASLTTTSAIEHESLQSGSSAQGSSLHKGGVQHKPLSSRMGPQKTAFATHKRHGIGPSRSGVYARASAHELGEAGTGAGPGIPPMRMREIARSIPRISNVGTEVRIDAVVPRQVRQAAAPLPPEVQRMHPHFRNDRVFRYRDQVVIVNPATSRIVAIVKARA
jgi:hypothetical protein